ncbi:mitoferrin-2-like [Porites lutea]|uniref:mitoferrin-2-like n=1 Tax=Porites lutea TaxID=51062 RepID=UPI003CC5940A
MDESEYESLPTERVTVHLAAGALAGVMEHCVMYPVDCVKTRMQSLRPHPNAIYRNMHHAFKSMVTREGLLTPFRGINVVALGAGPAHALYFSTYEATKKFINGNQTTYNPLSHGIAGVCATVFHDGAMNPIEVVKQRMQVYGSPYRSVLHCVRTVVRDEGVRAFYRSYTTQLSMNIPFQTLHFTVYEFTRETMNPTRGYDPKTHVVAGATAGAVAAALTTPLDVAKTLLNTQERGAVAIVGKPEGHAVYVSGMLTAFRSIYRLRGFSGYFQGLRARVLYQMPSCAICWSVYEFFKHFLHFAETEAEYELSPV